MKVFSVDLFDKWCDRYKIHKATRKGFLEYNNLEDGSPEYQVPKMAGGDWVRWLVDEVEYQFVNFLKIIK